MRPAGIEPAAQPLEVLDGEGSEPSNDEQTGNCPKKNREHTTNESNSPRTSTTECSSFAISEEQPFAFQYYEDTCVFCHTDWHRSEECRVAYDLEMRKALCRRQRRCERCLFRPAGHPNCNIICSTCLKKHNVALCEIALKASIRPLKRELYQPTGFIPGPEAQMELYDNSMANRTIQVKRPLVFSSKIVDEVEEEYVTVDVIIGGTVNTIDYDFANLMHCATAENAALPTEQSGKVKFMLVDLQGTKHEVEAYTYERLTSNIKVAGLKRDEISAGLKEHDRGKHTFRVQISLCDGWLTKIWPNTSYSTVDGTFSTTGNLPIALSDGWQLLQTTMGNLTYTSSYTNLLARTIKVSPGEFGTVQPHRIPAFGYRRTQESNALTVGFINHPICMELKMPIVSKTFVKQYLNEEQVDTECMTTILLDSKVGSHYMIAAYIVDLDDLGEFPCDRLTIEDFVELESKGIYMPAAERGGRYTVHMAIPCYQQAQFIYDTFRLPSGATVYRTDFGDLAFCFKGKPVIPLPPEEGNASPGNYNTITAQYHSNSEIRKPASRSWTSNMPCMM